MMFNLIYSLAKIESIILITLIFAACTIAVSANLRFDRQHLTIIVKNHATSFS
jgi:hypothetical protein